jgi:CDP-6-deoxy-D-xylo-4-hexulose-3-dehydrase
VSDGYNFRNTEFGAVLGLTQLKRLDKFIETRRRSYEEFVRIMSSEKNKDNFYPIVYNKGNSCFCFPFICKTKETKLKLIEIFNKYKIEYRPVVGGNLLRQPYLKNYTISCKKQNLNVDLIHENGVYIGNNQFVSQKDMNLLENILGEL